MNKKINKIMNKYIYIYKLKNQSINKQINNKK